MDEVLGHAFFDPLHGVLREHTAVEEIRALSNDDNNGCRKYRKVMISYCWADSNFVLSRLAPALAPLVDTLWLDRLGGESGIGEWTRASMEAGVRGSEVIIAVVSPQYIKSKNCGFEMELSAQFNKTIIPIMFGIPFAEWPPKKIGQTPVTTQFATPNGDMKLFVDMGNEATFQVKLDRELLPRLAKGDPVEYIRSLVSDHAFTRSCPKVMVSYSWANSEFVLQHLAPTLAPLVSDLWLDRLGGINGIGEWTRASMDAGVRGSDVIIAVVSPQYIKSKNCGFEMELAAKYGKTIIPVVYGVPFADWPPATIGETAMTTQFINATTGDMKLFVDMTDESAFRIKFEKELLPRLDPKMSTLEARYASILGGKRLGQATEREAQQWEKETRLADSPAPAEALLRAKSRRPGRGSSDQSEVVAGFDAVQETGLAGKSTEYYADSSLARFPAPVYATVDDGGEGAKYTEFPRGDVGLSMRTVDSMNAMAKTETMWHRPARTASGDAVRKPSTWSVDAGSTELFEASPGPQAPSPDAPTRKASVEIMEMAEI